MADRRRKVACGFGRVAPIQSIASLLPVQVEDVEWVWSAAAPYLSPDPAQELLGAVFAALTQWVRTGEIAVLYGQGKPIQRFWIDGFDSQQVALRLEDVEPQHLDECLKQWQIGSTGLQFVAIEVAHFDAALHPSPDLFPHSEARSLCKRLTPLFVWYTPENHGCMIAEFSAPVASAMIAAARSTQRRERAAALASPFKAAMQWLERWTADQADLRHKWLTEQPLVPIVPVPGEVTDLGRYDRQNS